MEAGTAQRPSSLAEVRKARNVTAPGPSGLVYELRPMNLERHALAGGLPEQLRAVAQGGTAAIDRVLSSDEDTPEEKEKKAQVLTYLDDAVRMMVVQPELPADFDMDELPPSDYRWLLMIAMGEEDYDGEGRRLWGREPLSRFRVFRDQHACPDDCKGCAGVQALFSPAQR